MFGILLVILSTIPEELATSLGKFEVHRKREGPYTMAFLSVMLMPLLFLITAAIKQNFVFTAASLPTFTIRIILELLLTSLTVKAIIATDRSMFGFIRTGTIPLLLIIDLLMGYEIGTKQLGGITLILIAITTLLCVRKMKRNGLGITLASTTLAAITISFFKYDIAHFNSLEAEQFFATTILAIYFFAMANVYETNPFRLLKEKVFAAQPVFTGIAGVVGSSAYLFAPASIIVTAIRASNVLVSIIAGRIYFHEKHLVMRLIVCAIIILGLLLLA